MNEKPVKVLMDFDEALRRIAKTPKGDASKKGLVNPDKMVYNHKEAQRGDRKATSGSQEDYLTS